MWLVVGTPTATAAANRTIDVWKNLQSARRATAEADLWVTAANVLQATIDAPIPLDGHAMTGYDEFDLPERTIALLSELESTKRLERLETRPRVTGQGSNNSR